jgi:hypothetical protein
VTGVAATPVPRFAALHVPDYRRYFALGLVSMMADNIEHVISYWVIFQKFHSPALGGFAVISHWVPFLLFSVYSGALADRYDCRKLMQVGIALFMVASGSWGLLFFTDTLQMWHAVAILIIHGFAGVIVAPAAQLIVHDMVGVTQLHSAIRLNATSRNLAILLGPAVGGGLMLLCGPAGGLLVNVLIYAPFAIFLARIPYTGHTHRAPHRGGAPRLGFEEMLRVFARARADRRLMTMIVLGGVTAFFVGNAFQAQMPEYACRQRLHGWCARGGDRRAVVAHAKRGRGRRDLRRAARARRRARGNHVNAGRHFPSRRRQDLRDRDGGVRQRRRSDRAAAFHAQCCAVSGGARLAKHLDDRVGEIHDPHLGHAGARVQGQLDVTIVAVRRLGDLDDEHCVGRFCSVLPVSGFGRTQQHHVGLRLRVGQQAYGILR